MVVTTIYVTRHGIRGQFTLDPSTGQYSTNAPSPTGIPNDPQLAANGVLQSKQLANALSAIQDPPISHVYCSPFYRCLQTVQPFILRRGLQVKADNGIGEWFGTAPFKHPSPASPSVLQDLFPFLSLDYKPSIIPSPHGESITQLHDRIAYALQDIIADADARNAAEFATAQDFGPASVDVVERKTALLICSHAASLIAIGRVLTGNMPDDISEQDFKAFTCGISKFQRQNGSRLEGKSRLDWQGGKGVAGGWTCLVDGDCTHLEGGGERGWYFQGEESFLDNWEKPTDAKL